MPGLRGIKVAVELSVRSYHQKTFCIAQCQLATQLSVELTARRKECCHSDWTFLLPFQSCRSTLSHLVCLGGGDVGDVANKSNLRENDFPTTKINVTNMNEI